MSETTPAPRRRERVRRARPADAPAPARHCRGWSIRGSPSRCSSTEQVERIVDAAFTVPRGVRARDPRAEARDVYVAAGRWSTTTTQLVRLGRDLVARPRECAGALRAARAQPARDLHVGGNVVNFGPVDGTPHITDLERGRRYGTLEEFRDDPQGDARARRAALAGRGGDRAGGRAGAGAPSRDVPRPRRVRRHRLVRARRRPRAGRGRDRDVGDRARDDGRELAARPTLMSITNVNSPRRVDEEILDNVMTMAAHGQCVCITPFTLMGAMAPVTLAGALVQQTAEALGVIALCQMFRPGTPVCAWAGSRRTSTCAPARRPSARPNTSNAALVRQHRLAGTVRLPVPNRAPSMPPRCRRRASHLGDLASRCGPRS